MWQTCTSQQYLYLICCVSALVTLALLAWGSTAVPRLQWVTSSLTTAMDGMPDAGHSTAVPPGGERLFGGPLPSVSLDSETQAFQPEAYRRCVVR
jgi:hypothetical protein